MQVAAAIVKLGADMATRTRRKYSPRLPREERREQLLDATLKLIAESGYGGVSMEAVAREAEIAKTVVYDAFPNQQELLMALLEREQERVLSAIAGALPRLPLSGDPGQILGDAIARGLEAVREYPDTWRLILLPADGTPPGVRDEVHRNREALVRQIEPMVAWGIAQLGLGGLDQELAAYVIMGAAEDAARLTLTHGDQFPPERVAKFSVDLLSALDRSS